MKPSRKVSRNYSIFIKPIHFLGDFVIINGAFFISYFFRFSSFSGFVENHYLLILMYFNLSWIVATYILASYNLYRVMGNERIFTELVKLLLLHFLMVAALIGITHAYDYSRQVLLSTYFTLAVLVPLWRLIILYFLKLYRVSGGNYRRVVIVGYNETSVELQKFFEQHPEYGYRFLGFFDNNFSDDPKVKGTLTSIEDFFISNEVDEIYCSISGLTNEQVQEIVDFADNNLIRVKLLPESTGFFYKNLKTDFYDHLPVLIMRSIPLDDVIKKNAKRIFDILFSLIVIILILSWLMPIVALLIKLDSRGPVFFKQKRSGIEKKDFWCWKFRTMRINSEADIKQATPNDERITRLGKFLRRYNFDELPQFFNVFIGNMSVCGPRPHMIMHTEQYSQLVDKYMVRHFIKPGITGLSQVMGYRGETKDTTAMKNRIRIDIFYIENWTFFLDLKIIVMTVTNMFKGDEKAF